MGAAISYYVSFLTRTETKTREDYLRLFAVGVGIDVMLMMLQLPALLIGAVTSDGPGSGGAANVLAAAGQEHSSAEKIHGGLVFDQSDHSGGAALAATTASNAASNTLVPNKALLEPNLITTTFQPGSEILANTVGAPGGSPHGIFLPPATPFTSTSFWSWTSTGSGAGEHETSHLDIASRTTTGEDEKLKAKGSFGLFGNDGSYNTNTLSVTGDTTDDDFSGQQGVLSYSYSYFVPRALQMTDNFFSLSSSKTTSTSSAGKNQVDILTTNSYGGGSWTLIRLLLMLFLLADAAALAALRCKVRSDSFFSLGAEAHARLLCPLRFCVGWGSTTCLLYGAVQFGQVFGLWNGDFFWLLITIWLVLIKLLRVIAVASFEKWLQVSERPLIVRGVRAQL
ncbi:unnamed protein product [Amoebophrya sp. A120]|nr:unnamed protein product [Amoebophrya sp. A120]|eukprot:GSA120T00024616001.1